VVDVKNSKVPGVLFASIFRYSTQPSGLVLLSDALWYRSQIFRVDLAIAIVFGVQYTALSIGINSSGIERFCSTNIGVKDNKK